MPVPVIAVSSSGAERVGDNGDEGEDVPSVSLDVPVLAFAVAFAFASVPSRTISKGRDGERNRGRGGVCRCT